MTPRCDAQDARSAQHREELLEELHRDVAAPGELADRDRALGAGAGELGQGSHGVGRLGRDREHARGRSLAGAIRPASPDAPCRPAAAPDGADLFFNAEPDLNSGLGTGHDRAQAHPRRHVRRRCSSSGGARSGGTPARSPRVAVTLLYAISDEWHQTFVEGRHGSALDVLVDASGVMIAYGLVTRRGTRAGRRPRAGGPPPAAARRP